MNIDLISNLSQLIFFLFLSGGKVSEEPMMKVSQLKMQLQIKILGKKKENKKMV